MKAAVGVGNWFFGELVALILPERLRDPPVSPLIVSTKQTESLVVNGFLFTASVSEL